MADAPADPVDPVVAAGERIRETAKWLTVSLAALGTVLLAGSQLSDLGALSISSPRLWIAVVGGAVAVVATFVVLGFAIRSATSPLLSLQDLADPDFHDRLRKGSRAFLQDPDHLAGKRGVAEFADLYSDAVDDRAEGWEKLRRGEISDDEFGRLDEEYVRLNDTARILVKMASYEVLATRWQQAYLAMLVAGGAGTVGLATFAWGANPPESVTATTLTPAVLREVTDVELELTSSGREALSGKLGDDCDVEADIQALQIGETDAGPDVLVQQDGCAPVRFIAVPGWAGVG